MSSKRTQENHMVFSIVVDGITLQNTLKNTLQNTKIEQYELNDMMRIKQSLNAAKSKFDVYYDLAEKFPKERSSFRQFNDTIDIYKPLRFKIETDSDARHVSNAWLKYWEIFNIYCDFRPTLPIKAFFNAELPGAALCAFNHYMCSNNIPYSWQASSYADGLGDTYGLLAHNREKWLMDDKNNGDMTKIENILAISGEKVDFYSHDAGIDVSEDFNNQETLNAKIHLGCALAG